MIHQINTIQIPLTYEHFSESYCLANNALYLAGGRGASLKVTLDGIDCVLRRYLRGGLIARFLYDQYLWLGVKKSRVVQESLILEHAKQANINVPEFIAYSIERQGIFYRQALITRFIPNQGSLAEILNNRILTPEEWAKLALAIAKMHDALINHVDLNANNVLYGEDNEFYVIDFDKAKIMVDKKSWPNDNINRLHRSLLKLKPKFYDETQWMLFIKN